MGGNWYGGWNAALVLPGILELFGIDTGPSGVSALADPASMPLDLGELFSGFDPTAMSANFATLIEDLTSAWAPELAASVLNVF
ncbi:MAG: hypothetical protein WCC28_24880 [Mycobacterium sp.]|uniref:hypothetical protein n=1 Tax=Mycobacterium sp. TaxID=1785 RepID=UPI003C71F93C